MHPQSLCAVWCFTHVYRQAQTIVHMHLTNYGYSERGIKPNTPFGAPCLDKDGKGPGISGLYLWVLHPCVAHSDFFIAGFLYIYHDVQKSSTVGVILESLEGTSKSLVPSKTSVTMTEAGGIRRVLVRWYKLDLRALFCTDSSWAKVYW